MTSVNLQRDDIRKSHSYSYGKKKSVVLLLPVGNGFGIGLLQNSLRMLKFPGKKNEKKIFIWNKKCNFVTDFNYTLIIRLKQ